MASAFLASENVASPLPRSPTKVEDTPVTSASPADDCHTWIKSSRSVAANACVEVAKAGSLIALRDSKTPHVAPFYYTRAEFDAFLYGAKRGEFDHLLGDARPVDPTAFQGVGTKS